MTELVDSVKKHCNFLIGLESKKLFVESQDYIRYVDTQEAGLHTVIPESNLCLCRDEEIYSFFCVLTH